MPKLDPRPARQDLTSRECSKLLGGLIGSLGMMAPLETIREAVRWWAEADGAWREIENFKKFKAGWEERLTGPSEKLKPRPISNVRSLRPHQSGLRSSPAPRRSDTPCAGFFSSAKNRLTAR